MLSTFIEFFTTGAHIFVKVGHILYTKGGFFIESVEPAEPSNFLDLNRLTRLFYLYNLKAVELKFLALGLAGSFILQSYGKKLGCSREVFG